MSKVPTRSTQTASSRRTVNTGAMGPVVAFAIALVTAGTFIVDVLLPLGIAAGIPYVAPVLAAAWLSNKRYIVPVAFLCTLLTAFGFFLSPDGAMLWAVFANRLLAVGAVWTIAIMALQRKRVEDALSDRVAATRAILDSTADGILTLDADGRLTSANPAAESLFGYDHGGLPDLPFGALLDESGAHRFDDDPAGFLSNAARPAGMPYEMTGRRRDGTEFPMEVAVATLSLSEGTRHAVTIHDITEQRLLERHLLHSSEEQRQSIAHLLHEHVGQSLTGLNLISRQLARRLALEKHPEAQEASDVAALLHEADEFVLQASREVAPVRTDDGLDDALKRFAATISKQSAVRVTVVSNHEPQRDHLEAAELYRIVQTVVEWALDEGRPDAIEIMLGDRDDASSVNIRLRGAGLPDASRWDSIARRLEFRARLLDRTIGIECDERGETRIVCRSRRGNRVRSDVRHAPRRMAS